MQRATERGSRAYGFSLDLLTFSFQQDTHSLEQDQNEDIMSEKELSIIKPTAEIFQIKTRPNFVFRLILDLPEIQAEALKMLIEIYQGGLVFEIASVEVRPEAGS